MRQPVLTERLWVIRVSWPSFNDLVYLCVGDVRLLLEDSNDHVEVGLRGHYGDVFGHNTQISDSEDQRFSGINNRWTDIF